MSSPIRGDVSSSSEESDEGILSSVVTVRKSSAKKDISTLEPRTRNKDRSYQEEKERLQQRYLNAQKERRQAKEELRKEERKRQNENEMHFREKHRKREKSISPKEKSRLRRRQSVSSSPDRFLPPQMKVKKSLPSTSKFSLDRVDSMREKYEIHKDKKDRRDYRSDSKERVSGKQMACDIRDHKVQQRSRSPPYRSSKRLDKPSRENSPPMSAPSSRNASPKMRKSKGYENNMGSRYSFDRNSTSRQSSRDRHREMKRSSPPPEQNVNRRSSSNSSGSFESGAAPDEELVELGEDLSDGEQLDESMDQEIEKAASDSEREFDREQTEEYEASHQQGDEPHPLIPKRSRFESSPSASNASSDSVPGGRVIQHRERDSNDDSNPDEEVPFNHYSDRSGSTAEAESPPLSEASEQSEEEAPEPQSPPKPTKPYYYPAIQGCRSVEEFQHLNRIEEGTYGVVYRAYDKKCNEVVALKRLKMEKEKNGFPITSLREISTLMKSQHKNVVTVREVVVGSNMDKIYLVMDYVEHDLKALMETMKQPFLIGEIKCLMHQLLEAVHHLHDNWILHRDLKTSNLLLSHKGILKVGDFGLAREYGSPLKNYTDIVVTLWYRAPELLLGGKPYTCPIDLWSVGCIFGELLLMKPLFPGKGETDQLNLIFKDLGTPTERIWEGVTKLPGMKKCAFTDYAYNQLSKRFGTLLTKSGFDFLNRFLTYNPTKRITAQEALKHPYFDEKPLAISPDMFPTWPAKSEGNAQKRKQESPRPPSGRKDLEDTDGGFHMSGANHGISKSGVGFHLHF